MAKLDGRCLCGAVTYTSEAEPVSTLICHCRDCQRSTGAAFSIIVGIPRESLHVSGETGSFSSSAENGTTVDRGFCPQCGSALFQRSPAEPELVFIKAGTLVDKSWLAPTEERWTSSAHPYVKPDAAHRQVLPRGA